MMKTLTSLTASLLLAMSLTVTSYDQAEARRGRNAAIIGGIALGALALGAAGAYGRPYHAYGGGGGCYRGPRECYWVDGGCRYNRYGDYVCRRGHRECARPTYCD